ncbi:alpha/beta hydrolase [Roseovarius salinarum]|uniref:alpha/beta hydrolase n=1 Tax=Roseovarius salinarum TaxID=1981892 RepID=UPI000C33220A|nr:alpha/beta hydrolase [Roseovarius salinarum]
MSVRRRLLNLALRLTEKPMLARIDDSVALRDSFEAKARFWFRPPRGAAFRDGALEESGHAVPVHWASVPGVREGPAILYFHGGGYVFGSPRTHRAMLARLSALTGLPACLPDYRLAPEHPFPAALDDALTAYRALAAEGPVILGGDSAGGGLALAVLAEVARLSLPQPLGSFAFSPLTDLTFSGRSLRDNARADPMLPASRAGELAGMYLHGADADDPRASPLFADFAGAGPVWLTAGDTEILLDDTRRMARRLSGQGVPVACRIAPGLPHVWPMFPPRLLPEARETLLHLAGWISCLSSRPAGS